MVVFRLFIYSYLLYDKGDCGNVVEIFLFAQCFIAGRHNQLVDRSVYAAVLYFFKDLLGRDPVAQPVAACDKHVARGQGMLLDNVIGDNFGNKAIEGGPHTFMHIADIAFILFLRDKAIFDHVLIALAIARRAHDLAVLAQICRGIAIGRDP